MKKIALSQLVISILPSLLLCQNIEAAPSASGHVRFFNFTDMQWESILENPGVTQRDWLNNHFYRMLVHEPYFDEKKAWYGGGLAYIDSYAIYVDDPVVYSHPEWILHDTQGNKLYIPWACQNGACTQFAGDIGNPNFRQYMVQKMAAIVTKGYRGIWLDDVNFTWRISDGYGNTVLPIDNATGSNMTLASWQAYFAQYVEQIRAALPNAEIAHNIIWYSDTLESQNPYINRAIDAADYINIERGGNDDGLVGGGSQWGYETFLRFIDYVHGRGTDVILMDNALDEASDRQKVEYGLATWLLVSQGNDLLSNIATNKLNWTAPDTWWHGYNLNLGAALGERYLWNNLLRRDFECGMVLLNQPNMPTVNVNINNGYTTIDWQAITSVTLQAKQASVLLGNCNTSQAAPETGPVSSKTFQQGVDGYLGARDATLASLTPTQNRGASSTLSMQGNGANRGALIAWDISAIPQNAVIESVNLSFNTTNPTAASYEIFEMKRPWVASQANWNEYAQGKSWALAGAGDFEDRGATVLGTLSGNSLGLLAVNLNADGIALVQSWVNNPSRNQGFYMMDYLAADNLVVSSNEATVTLNRPKLYITYNLP